MSRKRKLSLIDRSNLRRMGLSYLLSQNGIEIEVFSRAAEYFECHANRIVFVHDDDDNIEEIAKQKSIVDNYFSFIVYSDEPNWKRAVKAFERGAKTYVALPEQANEIAGIIAEIESEFGQIDDARTKMTEARGLIDSLSRREREVLAGLIAGENNRAIAEKLALSPRTVEVHRTNICRKLRAKNVVELLHTAMDAGFDRALP